MLRLEPNRDAPPLIVTDTSVLVPDPSESQTWHEIAWTPTLDPARLHPIFGEVLAVETTDPSFQLAGDTIPIIVEPDRYLGELAANDSDITNDERDQVPTFTAVVDALGRVSALIVDTDPSQPNQSEADHRNRYIVTSHFDEFDPIAAPRAEDREPATLADISYPTPDASCEFGL